MGVELEFIGHQAEQPFFDFQHGFAVGDAGAIADAKNMRVDRDGRFAETPC